MEQKKVFIDGDNIISSLGFTTDENMANLRKGKGGINIYSDRKFSPEILPLSLINTEKLNHYFEKINSTSKTGNDFTRYEKLSTVSVENAVSFSAVDTHDPKTLFIFSSTKGNIDLLEPSNRNKYDKDRIYLWRSARLIAEFFGNPNIPLVISNACISGVLAIITGARLIRMGRFENVIVSGADIISEFVVSGFMSFQSLSQQACRPFDALRDGLTLGEGSGTIILTSRPGNSGKIKTEVLGGAGSNDANHISGPSRTGEELSIAINKTINESGLTKNDIGFISAHGTGTVYNDEMEAKALSISGLESVPVNSFKGFWGHTLGAAGIIESVAAVNAMKENILIPSKGYSEHGVPKKINVITELGNAGYSACLKTASGFGGCNAAIVFKKNMVLFQNEWVKLQKEVIYQ